MGATTRERIDAIRNVGADIAAVLTDLERAVTRQEAGLTEDFARTIAGRVTELERRLAHLTQYVETNLSYVNGARARTRPPKQVDVRNLTDAATTRAASCGHKLGPWTIRADPAEPASAACLCGAVARIESDGTMCGSAFESRCGHGKMKRDYAPRRCAFCRKDFAPVASRGNACRRRGCSSYRVAV